MPLYSFLVDDDECQECGHVLYDPESLVVGDIKTNIGDEGSMFHMMILDPNQEGTLILINPVPVITCAMCNHDINYDIDPELTQEE